MLCISSSTEGRRLRPQGHLRHHRVELLSLGTLHHTTLCTVQDKIVTLHDFIFSELITVSYIT